MQRQKTKTEQHGLFEEKKRPKSCFDCFPRCCFKSFIVSQLKAKGFCNFFRNFFFLFFLSVSSFFPPFSLNILQVSKGWRKGEVSTAVIGAVRWELAKSWLAGSEVHSCKSHLVAKSVGGTKEKAKAWQLHSTQKPLQQLCADDDLVQPQSSPSAY